MIGKTVSHYKILSHLGSGGMGEVFLAEDTKLDRQVALKFLPAIMWNDADAHQCLIREAKAVSQLDHPNIVTIHGIEESEGRPFIIMAYVSATTLDKYIASRTCTIDDLVGLTLINGCRSIGSAIQANQARFTARLSVSSLTFA